MHEFTNQIVRNIEVHLGKKKNLRKNNQISFSRNFDLGAEYSNFVVFSQFA